MVRRIYLKLLWLNKSYTFNWAHKPLCEKHRHDVIRLGRIYLCRSCSCVYLGIFFSFVILLCCNDFIRNHQLSLLVTLSTITLPLSHPSLYKKLPRRFRDALRFSLGLLLALLGGVLLRGNLLLALPVAILLYLSWRIYYRK